MQRRRRDCCDYRLGGGGQAPQRPHSQLTSLPSSAISGQEPGSAFLSRASRGPRVRRVPSPATPTCALGGAWGTC